jgi:hypothetical protein
MYKSGTKRSLPTYTIKLNTTFTSLLEHYFTLGMDFKAHIGGKSHTLIFPNLREKYITDFIKNQAFIAARMIKRDVERVEIAHVLEDIKQTILEDNNRYYNANPRLPYSVGDCYLVDINSAYLSVLMNFDLIDKKTFDYVNYKCPKKERLVAVGMLAQRKHVYTIKKGQSVGEPELIEAPTRYLFNLCIQEVDQAMTEIAKELPRDFLFYWVDGIYLKTKEAANMAMEMLTMMGFKSKIIRLLNMECLEMFVRKDISFTEVNKDGSTRDKLFRVPNPDIVKKQKRDIRNLIFSR